MAPFKLQQEQPESLQREQKKEDQQKERDRQAEEQEKEAQREEVNCWKDLQSSTFSNAFSFFLFFIVMMLYLLAHSLASEAAGSL